MTPKPKPPKNYHYASKAEERRMVEERRQRFLEQRKTVAKDPPQA
jgi:hypothetical protein